jgi:uncharacterized protein YjbI with pentapeptide repeats
MNKYVRKLFSMVLQSPQTPQVVRGQPQHSPASPEEWRKHWQAQGQPWRTEPEIDAKRQGELARRRAVVPDIEKGIYPFRGMKLKRADVEWLLATHENGRGPVDWSDESSRKRRGLDVRGADLRQADLHGLPLACLHGGLSGTEWTKASVEQRNMAMLHLEGANLSFVHLEGANLASAHLELGNCSQSHLVRADLHTAHLEGTLFFGTHLAGASLRGAFLDAATILSNVVLVNEEFGSAFLSDVRWGDTNLSLSNWTCIKILGDEYEAHQPMTWYGLVKNKSDWLRGYQRAVRANRQLALVLQREGLNEEAVHFAYRAQILQRKLLWKQRSFWKWLGSAMLALLAGYGYRIWRIFVAYLLIVLICAGAYFVLGIYYEPHLSLLEAVLTSVTAFHGRVFSEPFLQTGEPQLWVTAFEAVAGLVIEGVFIAMLTQKFFGK